VFRGHLELAADMVFAELPDKPGVTGCKEMIVTDTRADEDFLDTGKGTDLFKE